MYTLGSQTNQMKVKPWSLRQTCCLLRIRRMCSTAVCSHQHWLIGDVHCLQDAPPSVRSMFCGSPECCVCCASTKGQHHVTKQQLRGDFCDSHRRCNTYQWGRNCARYSRQHNKLHCNATSKVQVGRDKRELKLPVLRHRLRHVS